MDLPLTAREIELLLRWKETDFWPDEARVRRKLRQALERGEAPALSRVQVAIVQGWVEEWLGGRYGGGGGLTVEESSIRRKLEAALAASE